MVARLQPVQLRTLQRSLRLRNWIFRGRGRGKDGWKVEGKVNGK